MDKTAYRVIMLNVRNAAGFLQLVDWHEMRAAAELHGSAADAHLLAVLADAAGRLPRGHG